MAGMNALGQRRRDKGGLNRGEAEGPFLKVQLVLLGSQACFFMVVGLKSRILHAREAETLLKGCRGRSGLRDGHQIYGYS